MTAVIDRGRVGRWESHLAVGCENYAEFCEGLRTFAQVKTRGVAMAAAEAAVGQAMKDGRDLTRVNDIRALFEPVPQLAVRNRMMRSLQEMTWRGLRASYADTARYVSELDAYDKKGPGKVEWDPAFQSPAYAKQPIHIQPGGYGGDPIAGY